MIQMDHKTAGRGNLVSSQIGAKRKPASLTAISGPRRGAGSY
jgi:hypothetical protein